MLNRDTLSLETSFGSSATITSVSNVNDLLGRYYDSILKLQNEITELQNFRDNAKMMILQYDNDIEYIANCKKLLNQQFLKIKKLIPNSEAALAQTQAQMGAQMAQQVRYQQQQIYSQQAAFSGQQNQNKSQQQSEIKNSEINWDVETTPDLAPYYNKNTVSLRYMINATSVICSVQFDPSGTLFAFSDPHYLRIVNVQNGQIICTAEMTCGQSRNEIYSRAIKFSPDGQYIAVAIAPKSIGIFSLAQMAMIKTLDGHQRTVSTLHFTMDSKYLISGGADGMIIMWDMNTFQIVKKKQYGEMDKDAPHNQDGAISSIVSLPSDQYFAVGFLNGIVRVFDHTFEHNITTFRAHNEHLLCLISTPKGELVTTSSDQSIKIWAPTTQGAINRMTIENSHLDFVTCACCSYTHDIILTGSKDNTIKAWNIGKGQQMFTAKAHDNTVLGMTHHPHSNFFVSCSGDGFLCLWSYQLGPEFGPQ